MKVASHKTFQTTSFFNPVVNDMKRAQKGSKYITKRRFWWIFLFKLGMKLYFVDNCNFIFVPRWYEYALVIIWSEAGQEPTQSTLLCGDEELPSDHKVIYVGLALGHV